MKKLVLFLAIAFCLNTNAQIISTFAGSGVLNSPGTYTGDGGQATLAGLNGPEGVACDASGNIYITDKFNNRIRKVNQAGIISNFAGSGPVYPNPGNFSGDGGQATAAQINYPVSVAVDLAGNVYFVDALNSRIRKINQAGIISTIAGNGSTTFSGDGGQATAGGLDVGWGIAVDAQGNIYIPGDSHRIRKISTSGIITTVVGTGIAGYSGDGGQATGAQINDPRGVAFDTQGNLYITEVGNECVRMVNTAGVISTVAGNTIRGYSGDGGQATDATLYSPAGVTCDATGNLYVADASNYVIRKINTAGIIYTIAGINGVYGGYSGDGGPATAAQIKAPNDLAIDATGNLYIADPFNNRIRKVTNASSITAITTFGTKNSMWEIYPNPNNGSFAIEPSKNTKQTMQLYDINGKLVLGQTIIGKTNIDASGLKEGVYNITIISNEGIANKRLVIVH